MAQSERIVVDSWVDTRLAALTPDRQWEPSASARLAEVNARRAADASRRRRWMVAAAAPVMLAVSLPGTRAAGARCFSACVAVPSRATQLWRADEPFAGRPPAPGSALGDLASDMLGTDAQGAPVRLSSFRGRVVIVNFWATWCPPCRTEIPRLNALRSRYAADGLEVIGVSIDEDGWSAVTPFAAAQEIDYPLALANENVTSAYGGVTALPTTFVIDRDGRIVQKIVGQLIDEKGDALQIGSVVGR